MQTVNKNQLLHVHRSKLAFYLLPLQVPMGPNYKSFGTISIYDVCWDLAGKHHRLSIDLIN